MEAAICAFVHERFRLAVGSRPLSAESPLFSSGVIDSFGLLELIAFLEDAYGVTIRAELADRTGRSVAPGAMYTALERLETKGLIASRMSDPTPQRGGRAKRKVTVTAAGMEAVTRAMQATGARRLIHGHTHRPAIHPGVVDGMQTERVVLAPWYEAASCISVGAEGLREIPLPR
jgi:DNA-binding PadR family transcriptional regulator